MFQDNFFKNKAFVTAQLWVFNGLASVSLLFFFSLFSAGKPENFSVFLRLAIVLFSIGLATNSTLAFLILIANKDPEYLDMLNRSKYFRYVPVVAMCSVVLAIIILIAFYSFLASTIFSISILVVWYLFFRTMKEDIKEIKYNVNKFELETIKLMADRLKSIQDENSVEK